MGGYSAMKVIFLDVDGVITYEAYTNDETRNIDPSKVELLKEIVIATNAKIVLSSTWKSGYNKITKEKRYYYIILEEQLARHGLEIYDITDDIPAESLNPIYPNRPLSIDDLLDRKTKHGTGRAAEIERYIELHRIKDYIILDDCNFDWVNYGMADRWIQPLWFGDNGGLQINHVIKSIKILNDYI